MKFITANKPPDHYRQIRERRKAKGLCTRCGKANDRTGAKCQQCVGAEQERRDQWKEAA